MCAPRGAGVTYCMEMENHRGGEASWTTDTRDVYGCRDRWPAPVPTVHHTHAPPRGTYFMVVTFEVSVKLRSWLNTVAW